LDEEFRDHSRAFFEQVRQGRFALVVSAVVQDELAGAPQEVRTLFERLLPVSEIVDVTSEVIALQQAYLDAGILTPKWQDDALHVALATAAGCKLIVSWNFKHIVHFQKIPRYNAVNVLSGYDPIAIHAPQEVIAHDDEDL